MLNEFRRMRAISIRKASPGWPSGMTTWQVIAVSVVLMGLLACVVEVHGVALSRRSALATTRSEAPTSAAMAAHRLAMPAKVNATNTAFTPSENPIF